MTEETTPIPMDLEVDEWNYEQRKLYKKAVGANPQYAVAQIETAMRQTMIGNMSGAPGASNVLLNIDEDWLLGFVWMARLARESNLPFEALWGEYDYAHLIQRAGDLWKEKMERELAAVEKAPLGESSDPTVPSNLPSENDSTSSSSTAAE